MKVTASEVVTKVLPKPKEDGPVVVIPTEDTLDARLLLEFFDVSKDDVLRQEFAKGVLLKSNGTNVKVSPKAEMLLSSWGNKWIERLQTADAVHPGPYFYKDNALWEALRLYDDTQGAFLISTKPTKQKGQFGICNQGVLTIDRPTDVLNDGKHGWSQCSCAVPSRHAANANSDNPFAGWRIAVKDAFDIQGTRLSMNNKAYLQLYPPAKSTASSIVDFVEGGSCILGKTKLSSFLSREEATESIDFQAAWNPRADGYQTTGGSSSGSAVAVAAYEWVDIGVGTDTNGSIRRPAQCNGVFGLRPSQGVFPQDGMFTVFKTFDVPGIFARDLDKLATFATKWYAPQAMKESANNLTPKIILPIDLLPKEDTPQKKIVLAFLQDLESFFEIEADRIDLEALWAQAPPEKANGQGMHQYLEEVGKNTFLYANYHSGAAFRKSYQERLGKKPFVSKFVEWRWKVGSTISQKDHEEAMRRLEVYKDWFLNDVMEVGKRNSFVVMQSEDVTPKYRDDLPPSVISKSIHMDKYVLKQDLENTTSSLLGISGGSHQY
ncbi:MAG: hypothetical protein Q9207_006362 [Kuettlingeria erythrocarpa]